MRRYGIPVFVLAAFVLFISCNIQRPARAEGASPTPVIVELFTSEGCSDCPPADRVLADLAERQPVEGVEIIGMSEHVDYWNQLGWADPFSGAQFSARQNEYAQAFKHKDIYTPQMVVDGQAEFVGSNRAQAISAITRAVEKRKARVHIEETGHNSGAVTFRVQVDPISGTRREAFDVFVAITEGNLVSKVQRGENKGKNLAHTAVVRSLSLAGKVDDATGLTALPVLRLASQWKLQDLQAVAFVQSKDDRRILGAASIPVAARQ
jgi:hypothetical protein